MKRLAVGLWEQAGRRKNKGNKNLKQKRSHLSSDSELQEP